MNIECQWKAVIGIETGTEIAIVNEVMIAETIVAMIDGMTAIGIANAAMIDVTIVETRIEEARFRPEEVVAEIAKDS